MKRLGESESGEMPRVVQLGATFRVGPPDHVKGPRVYRDYDQIELDAAYDQNLYAPLRATFDARVNAAAEAAHARLKPLRVAYGPSDVEQLDIYRVSRSRAPIFVNIHGGAWLRGCAFDCAPYAEPFVAHDAIFIAPDFIAVDKAGGDLNVMVDQVRRAVAWIWKNAATFGGDADQLYVGGQSSGGHLSAVVQVTDWAPYGLPPNPIKAGMCMSGTYELEPVKLSKRGQYFNVSKSALEELSPQRYINRLHHPLVVTYGSEETPEFKRQGREFAAAIKAAGKPIELIEAAGYDHFEMCESLANPYSPNGRAALAMMGLN
jgi:arylformamidase